MNHHFTCLLLLLTCLTGVSKGETEQEGTMEDSSYGPFSVTIIGVDIVTVGILYGFQCLASCSPSCTYNWTIGNITSQGSDMSLQLQHIEPTQTLTCTAINTATGSTESTQKQLKVTAGPSNIKISGPDMLTLNAASTFTCSADCYPSCSYKWSVILEDETYSTEQGSTISVTPPASTVISETLVCVATNTISTLFISTTLFLWVPSVSDISIMGDSAVMMGKQYSFICSAMCVPSCEFTWKYMGKTFKGDEVQIPVLKQGNVNQSSSHLEITFSDYAKTEPLTCEATNTLSNVTITTSTNLTVTDPISVVALSKALPIAGQSFSLQCVGSQDPTSVTWLKNNSPMPASGRVQLSSDNITMTFSPLTQADGGSYQCVATEGGAAIQSANYNMEVNYGPDDVVIVTPNKQPVGGEIYTTPGSTTELQCSASCFPVCSISWFYEGSLVATNASISFTPVAPQNETSLTCVAFNSVTKLNGTAAITVVVPDGPKNVVISGPDSLEVGVTASFTCSAECTPSCNFSWDVYGKTMTGSSIDITVNRYVSTESISCQAENTFTKKTEMVNETLSVSEPQWCGC